VRDTGETERSLSGVGLYFLSSTIAHCNMDVKSGAVGACRKVFGKWWLEPIYGSSEDAIFAG
jgi:hypothetical protein